MWQYTMAYGQNVPSWDPLSDDVVVWKSESNENTKFTHRESLDRQK